jgi:hypothetical protein
VAKPKAAGSFPALATLSNKLPSSSFRGTAVAGNSAANSIQVIVSNSREEVQVDPLPTSTLFRSLRNCIATLPATIPLASKADLLARFSGDPTLEVEAGGDPWESLDPVLNIVIGYGASVGEIAKIIRRGDHGMDGMYKWLEKCVVELKVDEGLLEMKVQRLIDAMVLLCVLLSF